jgi:hypothetical protein
LLTVVSTKSDIREVSIPFLTRYLPSNRTLQSTKMKSTILEWKQTNLSDFQHRQSDIHCHYIWRKWPRIKSDNVSFQHNYFEGYFWSQNKFCVCQLSIFCFHLHFIIVNYLKTLLFLQTENMLKVNNIPATNRKGNPRG